jgi:hypothetical protein
VIRFAISLAIFAALWRILLEVLFFSGGAERIGLTVITVLAATAGVVSYVGLGKEA